MLSLAWSIAKDTVSQWLDDGAARLGAALAYYAAFSIGPLLIVVIAVAGLFFGHDAVRGQVTGSLRELLGEAGATGVESLLVEAGKPQNGIWATLIGAITLLLGATGVVVQLKDALNEIWNVDAEKQSGIWPFLRTYIVSLAGVLALAFLLLVSLVVTAAIAGLGGYLASGLGEAFIALANFVVSFVFVTVLFAMMFKWLPDTDVAWKDVWIGALVTALLFTVGKIAIGLYLGSESMSSAFGAAASLAVLLVWVYYSAQIVFLGAEFTQVYAHRVGSHARDPRQRDSLPASAPVSTRASSSPIAGSGIPVQPTRDR
jgi:membrane protein